MIILVKPELPVFSQIKFPDFSGLLEGGAQYAYTIFDNSSNKFSLTIYIEYWLIEFGGQNKFKVINSESTFNVQYLDVVTLKEVYELFRQAMHHISAHVFNNGGFIGEPHSILPETTFEELRITIEDCFSFIKEYFTES
jgi:hypothetical protein